MTEMTETQLTGVQRAAVLLLSLGEADAAEVLKHMEPKEVQKIGITMATMTDVSREQVQMVIDQFSAELGNTTSLGVGSDEYIKNMLEQALGKDKAGNLVDRILLGRNTTGLDALKWMDPRAVADLVRNEHPQIIAIVMSHLEPDQAAQALKLLPERTRVDVVLRIATLDGIPPNALNELNEIMERQFSGNQNLKSSNIGGVQSAANILNYMDGGQDQVILKQIGDIDNPLGVRIQDLMFVFDDLVDLDDREMQLCCARCPASGWAWPCAEPTTRSRTRSPATCRSVRPRSCSRTWRRAVRYACPMWKWPSARSWPSSSAWPMKAPSRWAAMPRNCCDRYCPALAGTRPDPAGH